MDSLSYFINLFLVRIILDPKMISHSSESNNSIGHFWVTIFELIISRWTSHNFMYLFFFFCDFNPSIKVKWFGKIMNHHVLIIVAEDCFENSNTWRGNDFQILLLSTVLVIFF